MSRLARLARLAIANLLLVCLTACGLINDLLDKPCGGIDKMPVERTFFVPPVFKTEGDFYTEKKGTGERVLRWSTEFKSVCSEEHVPVTYELTYRSKLDNVVKGTGEYSTYPLFGNKVTMARASETMIAGTASVGLKQHWEGKAGEFTAAMQITVPPAYDDPVALRDAVDKVLIRAIYRLSDK